MCPSLSILGIRLRTASAVEWAIGELQAGLSAQGVTAKVYPRIDAAPAGDRHVIVAGGASPTAQRLLKAANLTLPSTPEAVCLVPSTLSGKSVLLAGGSDVRGLVYAVLELADRAKFAAPGSAPLEVHAATVEKPANLIRSCGRGFESEVEDKALVQRP